MVWSFVQPLTRKGGRDSDMDRQGPTWVLHRISMKRVGSHIGQHFTNLLIRAVLCYSKWPAFCSSHTQAETSTVTYTEFLFLFVLLCLGHDFVTWRSKFHLYRNPAYNSPLWWAEYFVLERRCNVSLCLFDPRGRLWCSNRHKSLCIQSQLNLH